ncbi:inorganic phosphate transporter [Nisaea nitritireducens]|uniref:inorganic phosphate transporter n=1 Tax=Nisaea nitritireducens TaxID=568392 RepID=UPI001866920C|nr:inorganic phosphate transporter [Nisaea nitritireducens]
MQLDISNLQKALGRGAFGGVIGQPVTLSFRQGLLAVAFACIALLIGYFFGSPQDAVFSACVALAGGYMALNVGANDVANSVGPMVGARALPLGAALLLAAVAETAGALLAGEHVAGRIAYRIVDQDMVHDPVQFVIGMLSALVAAALWINAANLLRAPISTTHAIIGGIVGVAVFAIGADAVAWPEISLITLGWFLSPMVSAAVAVLIFTFIRSELLGVQNKVRAARTWIPILIAAMAALFTLYLIAKGLANVWRPTTPVLITTVLAAFIAALAASGPYIRRSSMGLANRNQTVQVLFRVPLIVAGGFLAFSHGANDIANIAGPVTAILHVQKTSDLSLSLDIPIWVFVLGALGLSVGLLFFSSGMVRVVATRITKITPVRAYAIAMATASTVTAASWIDLPVSTTQIAVGAIFGIGIFREYQTRRDLEKRVLEDGATKKKQRLLIRREDAIRILAVWVITFPAAGLIAATVFWGINRFL